MKINTLIYLFFTILIFGFTPMNAQTFRAYVKAGDNAMEEKEYYAATRHYEDALSINDSNIALKYKYGEACRLLFAFEKAGKAYRDVANSQSSSVKYPMVYFWLGMVNRQLGDHRTAKKNFQRFLKINKSQSGYFIDKAQQEIISCDFAIEFAEAANDVTVKWLDKSVNTPYSDFAASLKGDSLYYSSLRFDLNGKDKGKEIKLSRILIAKEGERSKMVTGNINAEGFHTANSTFNTDGSTFYFTRCEGNNNEDIRCDIFVKKKTSDGWTKPEALPQPINLEGYTSTHPSVGRDLNTGQEVLFFASDRPGGFGKMDIWYTKIDADENYSTPENAGEYVNSKGNELTPFYFENEDRLYFSSDWHAGFGGYDIFHSGFTGNSFGKPQNAGLPVNSINNDLYFVLQADGLNGLFSSNRKGSLSLSEEYNCCYDIYSVKYVPSSEPPVTDTIPVVIKPEPEVPEIVEVPPVPEPAPGPVTNLEKTLPITLFFHNDEPDSNTVRNTTTISYDRAYAFYISLKPQYLREYARGNPELEYAINDFFDFEVKSGFIKLETFTENLLEALEQGSIIEVVIRGFTSPRAPTQYNVHLANRRISSVKNYFSRYKLGVFKPYLDSRQLTFFESPLGESTAPPGISDAYNDPRNSIYSPAASRERRVEILRIRIKD